MKRLFSGAPQANEQSASHCVSQRRSQIRLRKPVGDLCLEIAEFAKDRDQRTLSFLMRMAAAEAYDKLPDTDALYERAEYELARKSELIGLWDWDVSHDLTYVDPPAAKLFDVDPRASTSGLPIETFIKAIHPDDISAFKKTVYQVGREGGCLKTVYRVIHNGRIVWVYAKGSCFIGPGKIPVRFPGALFDITASMTQ